MRGLLRHYLHRLTMSKTNTSKIEDPPVPQTLWGSPQNWVSSTRETPSRASVPRTPTTLGHDRVEEIRFHPVSTKHLVPGSPTSAETDLPSGSGYRAIRYSFEVDRSSYLPIARRSGIVWYDAHHLEHFNYTRSRMKPRGDAPLVPVTGGKLWTPRTRTAELEQPETPTTVESV